SISLSPYLSKSSREITRILDTYKIKYEIIDISVSLKTFQEIRMKVSTLKAQPPQIFNGRDYCGVRDFEMFHKAKENKEILKFLKME
ncbi:SH3 domain-binding glutamic acid-rich-like protein 3, partial [Trichechus inunguis]